MDLTLRYRECGAECREDWLRMLACDNGVPLAEVQRAAAHFGDREDFGRLIDFCEDTRFAGSLHKRAGSEVRAYNRTF